MPFLKPIRLEALRRANFTCCYCWSSQPLPLQVHHIEPEAQGGPSILDNAAALCSNCHDDYGDNPKKKATIRRRRDQWYEQVVRDQSNLVTLIVELAQAHDLYTDRLLLPSVERKHEIDVLVCRPRTLVNCVGFSVQGWRDIVPEWRVVEVIDALRESVTNPETMLGELVIVTKSDTRMQREDGTLTDPLHYNNATRWWAVFGGRTGSFIRFEAEHTIGRYLADWSSGGEN